MEFSGQISTAHRPSTLRQKPSPHFTSGKVDLALELSKTTDVKVVSTTMAQAGRCQRAEISLDCTKAISKVHSEILYRWCLF